jgi:hypothetical protein
MTSERCYVFTEPLSEPIGSAYLYTCGSTLLAEPGIQSNNMPPNNSYLSFYDSCQVVWDSDTVQG